MELVTVEAVQYIHQTIKLALYVSIISYVPLLIYFTVNCHHPVSSAPNLTLWVPQQMFNVYLQGKALPRLITKDVSRLGALLCELEPSQLRLMAPHVLNSSLQVMASCQNIPQRHRADLIQLVTHTFG